MFSPAYRGPIEGAITKDLGLAVQARNSPRSAAARFSPRPEIEKLLPLPAADRERVVALPSLLGGVLFGLVIGLVAVLAVGDTPYIYFQF